MELTSKFLSIDFGWYPIFIAIMTSPLFAVVIYTWIKRNPLITQH